MPSSQLVGNRKGCCRGDRCAIILLIVEIIILFQPDNYKAQPGSCSCTVNNIMEMLRNESVKDILRGPPGLTGQPGIDVS